MISKQFNRFGTVVLGLLLGAYSSLAATSSQGVLEFSSEHGVQETTERLKKTLEAKGFSVFAVVPHSQAAEKVGVQIAKSNLIIFGNPKVGSKLMAAKSEIGLDLPMKALILERGKKVVVLLSKIKSNLSKLVRGSLND